VHRENVRSPEIENKQHLGGPPFDAFDRGQLVENLLVGHPIAIVQGWDQPGHGLFRNSQDVRRLRAGLSGGTEDLGRHQENVRRGRKIFVAENRLEAREDRSRRGAAQLLVDHRMYQGLEGREPPGAVIDGADAFDQTRHVNVSPKEIDGAFVYGY